MMSQLNYNACTFLVNSRYENLHNKHAFPCVCVFALHLTILYQRNTKSSLQTHAITFIVFAVFCKVHTRLNASAHSVHSSPKTKINFESRTSRTQTYTEPGMYTMAASKSLTLSHNGWKAYALHGECNAIPVCMRDIRKPTRNQPGQRSSNEATDLRLRLHAKDRGCDRTHNTTSHTLAVCVCMCV